jgi:hypothetical protein
MSKELGHRSHYRSKHCANRTHRLRSTLKVTHGRGREFKKPPVVSQDKIQDGQFVIFFCDRIRTRWPLINQLLASNSSSSRRNVPGHTRKSFYLLLLSQRMTQKRAHCATMPLGDSAARSTGPHNSSRNARLYMKRAVSELRMSSR